MQKLQCSPTHNIQILLQGRHSHLKYLVLLLVFLLQTPFVFAQYPLPANWQQQLKIKYDKRVEKQISLEEFTRNETAEYQRIQAIQKGAASIYQPKPSKSICGNGNFEAPSIDQSEWTGGYGSVDATGNPVWSSMTAGFSGGSLTNLTSRQTIVATGTDPNVGIPLVHGGNRALRIGNAVNGGGAELVSKTFIVTPDKAIISFWYAVVLQDPNHASHERPSFWVRVLDGAGTPLSGLVDLGNPVQKDKIWADSSNPFFKVKMVGGQKINYTDWLCADINLQKEVGKTVTIQFITEDCTQGLHYGYAYIDDFCGTCTSGNSGWVAFNQASSNCQQGKICFDYGLPTTGSATGTIHIQLEILQDGLVVTTLNSPVLNSGSQYCFSFEPCRFPNLDLSKGGFDFTALATPKIGATTLPQKFSGSKPNGHISGTNNDCLCASTSPIGNYCCDGINLVKNPNFESGNTGFTSQYTVQNTIGANTILPGQYAVLAESQATSVCRQWQVKDHTGCTNPGNNKVLILNGETTQPSSAGNICWQQTITGLESGASYKFCAYMKNLPACCFDVAPKVKIEITPGASSTWTTINAGSSACDWQLVSLSFTATSTSVTIKIYLEETGKGDGNDLAIDDISLQKVPEAKVKITVQNESINSSTCQISASVNTISNGDDALPGKGCKYVWVIGKMSTLSPPAFSGLPLFGGDMGNPSWGKTTTFPGFTCSTNQPYLVYLYVYDCDCLATGYDYQITMDNGRLSRLSTTDENALHALIKRLIQERQK